MVTEMADWTKYFKILKKCYTNSYLLNYQYKLLYMIIPNNIFFREQIG